MPLQIVRNDITKMDCDAIVNAANSTLLGGGGVDGAIHAAAGPELLEECRTLGGCQPGHAKVTGGYRLPARYVIHTVGPIWRGGHDNEQEVLAACYRNSLQIARQRKLSSIAFPLISAGAYGYPREQALQIAMDTIREFLEETEMLVYLVVFDRSSFQVSKQRIADIEEFIDEQYVGDHYFFRRQAARSIPEPDDWRLREEAADYSYAPSQPEPPAVPKAAPQPKAATWKPFLGANFEKLSLDELLGQVDESFSQMLLRKIDEKGMTDAQCYKKANIDRKLFSKIRKDIHYKPSKTTAIAFAIALELSLEETRDLLAKAGYALSHSSKFDIIIEYFIRKGIYDIYEINQALFAFDQVLLGG